MGFVSMTTAERLDAVQPGDIFEQKKTGRIVTVTDRLMSHGGYYTVNFTDDKGKPRSRWVPYFLENFSLKLRAGQVPLSAALTRPLAQWDTDLLTRLAQAINDELAARA